MTVFAMQAIGQLQPTQLNTVKPTTGFDVLDNHAGQRRDDIVSLGMRSIVSGTLVTLVTAAAVGVVS